MKFDDPEDRRVYAEQEVARAEAALAAGEWIEADEILRHAVHSGATAVDVYRAISKAGVARHVAGEPPL